MNICENLITFDVFFEVDFNKMSKQLLTNIADEVRLSYLCRAPLTSRILLGSSKRKLSKNEVNLRSSITMSLKFRYKITIKSLFSKEKSTYSIFLAIILPTYSVSNTINMPTYSIFNAINESTYSVLSFISWRNLNIFARLRQVTNYFEASAMSAARSSSLMFLPPREHLQNLLGDSPMR